METNNNLDRTKIRKLLLMGLCASILTGIGDFFLGYGEETTGTDFATSVMSSAPNLADWQTIAGGLLGMVGIFLEGIAFFGIYRLMADADAKHARIYKVGILGYIWLAPIGCHLNVGTLNYAYKYLLQADENIAAKAAGPLFCGFALPAYILLVCFWLPMIIIQFKAFSRGLTPYPKKAKWFNLIIGAIPALVISAILGMHTALGAGIGTMFLSFGNAFTFGGLLLTMPSEERFEEYRRKVEENRCC